MCVCVWWLCVNVCRVYCVVYCILCVLCCVCVCVCVDVCASGCGVWKVCMCVTVFLSVYCGERFSFWELTACFRLLQALDAETEFKTIPVRAKRPKLTKEKLTPHFDKLRDFKFLPFGGRGHEVCLSLWKCVCVCVCVMCLLLLRLVTFWNQASDMRMLMREYQKWAVMVEPNLTFNEFLNQCEKLTSAMRVLSQCSFSFYPSTLFLLLSLSSSYGFQGHFF